VSTRTDPQAGREVPAQFLDVAVSTCMSARMARASADDERKPEMLLKGKVAVVYGAGGAIGCSVARAFARNGATLFLTGRLRAPVEAVAKNIVSAGGSAEAAEVDALDEQGVDTHLQPGIDKGG